jgi:hypothetical protein
MSTEEQASFLESFIAQERETAQCGSCADPYLILATLYRSRGDLEKAARVLQSALPYVKEKCFDDIYKTRILKPLAVILEEGGFDPKTLAEVRAILKQK